MEYRIQVIADNSGHWAGNGLTFKCISDAKDYAQDLMCRWALVSNWRVVSAIHGSNENDKDIEVYAERSIN